MEAERLGPLPNREASKNPSPGIFWALWDGEEMISRWLISPFTSQGREHPSAHPSAAEGPPAHLAFPPSRQTSAWSGCIYFSAEKLWQLFLLPPPASQGAGPELRVGSLLLEGNRHTF